MLNFFKTTLLGGVIFLVPIVIFVAVVGKGLEFTNKLAEPLSRILPIESVGGVAVAHLVALAILVLICFIAGLVARTNTARRFVASLESNVLDRIPAYALVKAKAGSVLNPQDTEDMRPVLIRFDDSWQLGFEVEKVSEEKSLVYLPGAPDPWSGSVCAVTTDRLSVLDVNVKTASDLMKRLGKGSTATLKNTLKTALVSEAG